MPTFRRSSRISSALRLGLMLGGVLVLSLSFVILFTRWALAQKQGAIARAMVADDLGEYSVFYQKAGGSQLEAFFHAGGHGDTQAVRLTSPEGQVVFESLPGRIAEYAWSRVPPFPKTETGIEWSTLRHPDSGSELLIARRRQHDGRVLWFARTDAEDRAYLHDINEALLTTAGLALLICLLPILWFSRKVLRPVEHLIGAARALAPGGSGARLEASAAIPELQDFAAAFNISLARTEALMSELRAANDQLAHELRTPLARIRGHLDAALDARSETARTESIARATEETERTASLIHTILSIRAGDAGAMLLHPEEYDLRALAAEFCELYQAAAEQKGLRLILADGDPLPVKIDVQRMRQAIANLLDNALNYAPAGCTIRLQAARSGESALLSVHDTGPGLTSGEEEAVWQRFHRGSAATAAIPGLGLGLSLVRAVLHAHGGEATAGNHPEGGAVFELRLPV